MESSPVVLPIQDINCPVPAKEELSKENLHQDDNFSYNIKIPEKNNNMATEQPVSSPKNDINEIQNNVIPISVDKIDTDQIDKPIEKTNKCICNLDLNIRSSFMIKVYGILLTQFIITFGLILITQIEIIKKYLLDNSVLFIVLVCCSIAIFITAFIIFLCNPKLLQKVPINYIILFIITICESIILVYISICYTFEYVIGAMSFVLAISFSIFAISFFNKIDIKYLYLAMISLCFLLITYGLLAAIFRNHYLIFLYCFLGAVLFALFIIYDTTVIRDHFSYDDYILAAMTLYFDIIRFFIYVLRFLGASGGKNN